MTQKARFLNWHIYIENDNIANNVYDVSHSNENEDPRQAKPLLNTNSGRTWNLRGKKRKKRK